MLTLADTPTRFYTMTDTHCCLFDSNAFYLLLIYQTATLRAIRICKKRPAAFAAERRLSLNQPCT